MATYTIPTLTGTAAEPQVLRVTLGGIVYQITLRYNDRAGCWRMDLADDTGNALAAGLAVRNSGLPINSALFGHQGFPAGLLLALPTALPGTDANLDELGARVLLLWEEAALG